MKKLFRFVFKTILWIVVIALAIVLTLPLWIGPVAKTAANRAVPGITGTAFNLGDFGLNFYTGSLRVGDVTLYNPNGYDPSEAFKLGSFNVDVDVLSALSDTVVVRELVVRDVFVSYVSKDGVNNFDVIMENVQKATASESKGESAEPEEEKPESEEGKKEKKVIIDHLLIDGVTVQWGPVPLKLPTKIELTGIGRESNGIDWESAANEILDAIMKQMNALGQGIMDLGNALKDAGLEGANQVIDAVKEIDVQGATEAVGAAADKVVNSAGDIMSSAGDKLGSVTEGAGSAFGSAVEGAGSAFGSAVEGAGNAFGSAAEGAGNAFGSAKEGAGKVLGSTTDAVKDGAGKAMDATTDALKGAGGAIKGLLGK